MNHIDYEKVISLVKKAGELANNTALTDSVRMKGEADFVTAVDTSISSFLKTELSKVAPNIGFFSEEETGALSPLCWILDPIDGTTNLVYGYNQSSVSLALYDHGNIEFGIVYNPFNQETFTAYRGGGAFLNGKRLPLCPDREPKDSLVEFGSGSTRKHQADLAFSIGKEVFLNFLDFRRNCSSALVTCYIACGRLGGYFEKVLKPWDVAAGSLLLSECGCVCSTWEGEAVPFDKPFSFIAGSPKCHQKLMEIISHQESAD